MGISAGDARFLVLERSINQVQADIVRPGEIRLSARGGTEQWLSHPTALGRWVEPGRSAEAWSDPSGTIPREIRGLHAEGTALQRANRAADRSLVNAAAADTRCPGKAEGGGCKADHQGCAMNRGAGAAGEGREEGPLRSGAIISAWLSGRLRQPDARRP